MFILFSSDQKRKNKKESNFLLFKRSRQSTIEAFAEKVEVAVTLS